VEHFEWKGRESIVTIPWFLCGSARPCRLRTASFWSRWQALSCVLITCQIFMGPDKPNSFCNYLIEPHLHVSCGALLLEGE
jgi:hypothetical protein